MRSAFVLLAIGIAAAQPGPTPSTHGGLRVQGNQLLDASGQPFLLRGTQLSGVEMDGGTLRGTTFSTIRQRWNMNVVRLPVSIAQSELNPSYISHVSDVVRSANQLGLLVILAAHEEDDSDSPSSTGLPSLRSVQFWRTWAAFFRENPMVLFDLFTEPLATRIPGHQPSSHSVSDWQFWRNGGRMTNGQAAVGMQTLVDTIRSTGAAQPVIAMSLDDGPLLEGFGSAAYLDDRNVIYEVCPLYSTNNNDRERDRHFGFLSSRAPVLANDWDLRLDENSPECQGLPSSPAASGDLVQAHLAYFDAHDISWTASTFAPGKLIDDSDAFEPTQLYRELICGTVPWPPLGMGHIVQFHLWGAADADIITVNGASGEISLPQGGLAISYGLRMANVSAAGTAPYPVELGGISLQLTDAFGAVLLAPLKYVSDNQINFLVPVEAAPGPAQLAIVRTEGLGPFGKAFIAPVAPGLFTQTRNARGAVIGTAVQRTADGGETSFPISQCDGGICTTLPIFLSEDVSTQLILPANGLRNRGNTDGILVTIGGFPVPVLSAGPHPDSPGDDQIVLQLDPELRGLGEVDLFFVVQGQVSNSVRINVP